MTLAVGAAMIFGWGEPASAWGNTGFAPCGNYPLAEPVAIVAFVGHDLFPFRKDNVLSRNRVVSLARCERELNRTPASVHQRCHFAVKTTFSASKSLIFLASRRVGGVLMNFDVRRIQMPQFSFSVLRKKIQDGGPDTLMSPARPTGIN